MLPTPERTPLQGLAEWEAPKVFTVSPNELGRPSVFRNFRNQWSEWGVFQRVSFGGASLSTATLAYSIANYLVTSQRQDIGYLSLAGLVLSGGFSLIPSRR